MMISGLDQIHIMCVHQIWSGDIMKLYIEGKREPWDTSPNQLWYASKNFGGEIDIVTSPDNADVKMYTYYNHILAWINPHNVDVLFIESLDENDMEEFKKDFNCFVNCKLVLVESPELQDMINELNILDKSKISIWNKPTRVNESFIPINNNERTNDFVIVCNASRYPDKLAEVVKTYFAMCLKDVPDGEDGELIEVNSVDIFSAQELPFEVFNNIRFNGLQPNPIVIKTIARASLLISPYNGNGVPQSVVDALLLNTPVLIRDTKTNREIFHFLNERCFYKTEKDLAKGISYFMDHSKEDFYSSNAVESLLKFKPSVAYIQLYKIIMGEFKTNDR